MWVEKCYFSSAWTKIHFFNEIISVLLFDSNDVNNRYYAESEMDKNSKCNGIFFKKELFTFLSKKI